METHTPESSSPGSSPLSPPLSHPLSPPLFPGPSLPSSPSTAPSLSSEPRNKVKEFDTDLPRNYTGQFRLQYVSDLFLDIDNSYSKHIIVPHAPFLALLGNIGRVGDMCRVGRPSPISSEFAQFLFRQLAQFRVVFFVAGNHEAHTGTWSETVAFFRVFQAVAKYRRKRLGQDLGDFVFLDRTAYELELIGYDDYGVGTPITVLGCTLFSAITPDVKAKAAAEIVDFQKTQRWSVDKHNSSFFRDARWLQEVIIEENELRFEEENDGPGDTIILTHYSPTLDLAAFHPRDILGGLHRTSGSELLEKNILKSDSVAFWGFGHTQKNHSAQVDGLSIGTNQRGHTLGPRGLLDGYDETLVFELDIKGIINQRNLLAWDPSNSDAATAIGSDDDKDSYMDDGANGFSAANAWLDADSDATTEESVD
ncbi:hypothetical protein QBC39DRAFT_400868 [Podospora conica]|nr:hypothetical protein QBC39DRAFT_400868 [Schizothecium conicum]